MREPLLMRIYCNIFYKKGIETFGRIKYYHYLCTRNSEQGALVRYFSWLECLPVTQEVTSSSLVRTALSTLKIASEISKENRKYHNFKEL